jgi:hypothetical protein
MSSFWSASSDNPPLAHTIDELESKFSQVMLLQNDDQVSTPESITGQ